MSDNNILSSLKEISDSNKWITWEKKFEVGYKRIDEQHKELVNIINDLYEANIYKDLPNKEKKENLHSILKRLINYANYHFTIEEKIMKAVSYSDFKNHISKHRDFMDKIVEEINIYINKENNEENSDDNNIEDFIDYLRKWLFNHISIEDKKFVTQLKSTLKDLEKSESIEK